MGRFEGLNDMQWTVIKGLLPDAPKKRGKGYPHTPWRKVCNSIFWVLITGSRWFDIPRGGQWASKSSAHRWLGVWQEDGTLERVLSSLREVAFLEGQIDWERLAVDGFFSPGKGGGELVDYGYKGKGVTTHLLVDSEGNPIAFEVTSAKGDERLQVGPLLDRVEQQLCAFRKETGLIPIFEADKGYDAEALRNKLLKRKIYPLIPRRRLGKNSADKKLASWIEKRRWQVERAISWLQRKFRRLTVRWERKILYWKGLLNCGLIKFWIDRLVI